MGNQDFTVDIDDDKVYSFAKAIRLLRETANSADVRDKLTKLQPLVVPCWERLLDQYLLAAKGVRHEIQTLGVKKLRERRRPHLKKLLTPLVNLCALMPREIPYREIDGTYPFISESIWINKELNVQNLNYDRDRYSIRIERWDGTPDQSFDEPLHPTRDEIVVWEEYREGKKEQEKKDAEARKGGARFLPITTLRGNKGQYTLEKLWAEWIGSLKKEGIESKDLLDQILVAYTIKRAMNGDEKAVDKLTSIYENAAIGIAVNAAKSAKWRGLLNHIDDIKQTAVMLLRLIISGFSPEVLVQALIDDDRKQHLLVPKWVEKFYIYYLSEYVPERLNAILKEHPTPLSGLEIRVLLDVHSPIRNDTSFQDIHTIMVRRFNSCCFRPTRKGSLGTFLFGAKRRPMIGKFYQLLNDALNDIKNRDRQDREIPYNENVRYEDDDFEKDVMDKDVWEYARNAIHSKGFSERDADIFIRMMEHKKDKVTTAEIAEDYRLSRRQIYRIFDNIKVALRSDESFRNNLKI